MDGELHAMLFVHRRGHELTILRFSRPNQRREIKIDRWGAGENAEKSIEPIIEPVD